MLITYEMFLRNLDYILPRGVTCSIVFTQIFLLLMDCILWVFTEWIIFILPHFDILELLWGWGWLLHLFVDFSFDFVMLSLPLVAESPLDIFESIDLLLMIVIVISFLTDETFCNFSLTYFEIFTTSQNIISNTSHMGGEETIINEN